MLFFYQCIEENLTVNPEVAFALEILCVMVISKGH